MARTKTIAAISTALSPGGIGIVRISGPEAFSVADRIFCSKSGKKLCEKAGYSALFGCVRTADGEKLDDAVALVFREPKSYTGEDVVELSCHGGPYLLRQLLQEILSAGAASAQPGEFTKRAFINGKLDLAQAESVMQLIGAGTKQAARAAEAGNSGVLSKKIAGIRETLTGLSSHLAAWADFPEEDVPEVETAELSLRLTESEQALKLLLDSFEQGKLFREGVATVIAGKPNAGKSTLMNLLSGCERSIVTEHAGTTRDVVEETVLLGGIPLRLADTAGLRETEDPVESIGVQAARRRLASAQLVLAVFDASRSLGKEDRELLAELEILGLQGTKAIAVINKSDLPQLLEVNEIHNIIPRVVLLSAASGEGLRELEAAVEEELGAAAFDPAEGVLYTQRQREDVEKALLGVQEAGQALENGVTLDAVTVCVEDALGALYALTGERTSDEIVEKVFSTFCVGK